MTQMLRKQIYIPRRQQVQLKRLAKARGVSEAEVIRQAIDREVLLTAAQPTISDRSALEEFLRFGASRRATGDTTGRAWTRDELYDERLRRYGHADS
jgi:hypothetical protein